MDANEFLKDLDKQAAIEERVKAAFAGVTHLTWLELARAVDAPLTDLEAAVAVLREKGYDFQVTDEAVVKHVIAPPGSETHIIRLREGRWYHFGLISDNQLGNKTSRLDILQTAYDHYEAEGIQRVYHCGNIIDGYSPTINAFELIPEAGPSIERQCTYAAAVYPKKSRITTHFITGDCHEGWYAKGSGLNVGRHMESIFKRTRDDLIYVGHIEADIALRPDNWDHPRVPILRLSHPGGGSSYAKSYKVQKYVESIQGGEKPDILAVGHYHKQGYFIERNVHCFLAGCTADQSIFMRKHQIQAAVGYWLIRFWMSLDGTVQRMQSEFVPFFDRGFYQTWERF